MPEQSLALSRRIDAPVAQVWDVLTDLTKIAGRLRGITDVHIMTSGPYAVGTRWRETRTSFGMTAAEDMWVRRNDPLRSTVVEASSNGTDYRTTWELTPVSAQESAEMLDTGRESTELSMTFSATSAGGAGSAALGSTALSTLFIAVGLRATRKAMERDLDDIDTAAAALRSA